MTRMINHTDEEPHFSPPVNRWFQGTEESPYKGVPLVTTGHYFHQLDPKIGGWCRVYRQMGVQKGLFGVLLGSLFDPLLAVLIIVSLVVGF